MPADGAFKAGKAASEDVAAAVASYRLDWRLYTVQRSEELIAILLERELAFWREHVEQRVPPGAEPPPLELLKAIRRELQSILTMLSRKC